MQSRLLSPIEMTKRANNFHRKQGRTSWPTAEVKKSVGQAAGLGHSPGCPSCRSYSSIGTRHRRALWALCSRWGQSSASFISRPGDILRPSIGNSCSCLSACFSWPWPGVSGHLLDSQAKGFIGGTFLGFCQCSRQYSPWAGDGGQMGIVVKLST